MVKQIGTFLFIGLFFIDGGHFKAFGQRPSSKSTGDRGSSEKYEDLRDFLKGYTPFGQEFPDLPDNPEFTKLHAIKLVKSAPLFFEGKSLPEPIKDSVPLSMAELGQNFGYVLYRTTMDKSGKDILRINGLRGYAQVFINEKRAGTLNGIQDETELELDVSKGDQLDILVENLDWIDQKTINDGSRKGILGNVDFSGEKIKDWKMYPFPFKNTETWDFRRNTRDFGEPLVYKGTFIIDKIKGGTFLDMREWGKGIVILNDYILGHYWNEEPRQTLYVPEKWLHRGQNKVEVFEQLKNGKWKLKTLDHPILDDPQEK